jgi:predicted MFS family arabinose efflux permease
MALAGIILATVPLALAMIEARKPAAASENKPQSLSTALREASRHAGFWYLTAGFFVCGFQVAFISVHLPAYLLDLKLSPSVGASALAMIGLFNIAGSFAAGYLGGRYSKKYLLSSIYLLRAAIIAVFLMLPVTPMSVYLFAAVIGFLWLGTVPLTNGLVGQIFGVRYVSTLFGIVFFSHQLGSFTGVWLGGRLFDATGSYTSIWVASIALGILAAIINLPIDERPLARVTREAAA